jgi:hypothetical protein
VNGTKNKGQGTENANIEQPLGDVVAFAAPGVVGSLLFVPCSLFRSSFHTLAIATGKPWRREKFRSERLRSLVGAACGHNRRPQFRPAAVPAETGVHQTGVHPELHPPTPFSRGTGAMPRVV